MIRVWVGFALVTIGVSLCITDTNLGFGFGFTAMMLGLWALPRSAEVDERFRHQSRLGLRYGHGFDHRL